MKFYRIQALTMRYLLTLRDFHHLFDIFFYPIMDIALFGLMISWIQKEQSANPNLALMVLSSLALWSFVFQTGNSSSGNLLEEIITQNLGNLFSSPLTLAEWITASITFSILKGTVTFLFCAILIYIFFNLAIFTIGTSLIPFILLLTASGCSLGFFITAILTRGGQKLRAFMWSIPYILFNISAAIFPVELLPQWLQYISLILPTTYVFEGLRFVIATNKIPTLYLAKSLGLNIIYLIITITFFNFIFKQSKENGLTQVENI